MATIIPIASLLIAVIFQTSIVVRINILHGAADLVLLVLVAWVIHEESQSILRWGLLAGLMVGAASALPYWLGTIEYFLVVLFINTLLTRVWQAPLLLLFSTVFLGTFLTNGLDFFYLFITGVPFNFDEAFNLVILPSLILNIILALPIFALMGELTKQVYPPEVEV